MHLLKVSQVVEKLNISRNKVYKMINNGAIPSVNIGGCIRVPEDVLDEMIKQQLAGKTVATIEEDHVLLGSNGREGGLY